MAKQIINVGTSANDRKGDSLRAAFQKVNANFSELYTVLGLTDVVFKPTMLTQEQINDITPQVGMLVYNTTTGKFQGYAADANNDSTTGWADLH
jgi:hypothetical protein